MTDHYPEADPTALFEDGLPNLDESVFAVPTLNELAPRQRFTHPPRFLLLYGSLRERSYSRLLAFEAGRRLESMGGEVGVFDPTGLPLPDGRLGSW